jgi:hypothetical protein
MARLPIAATLLSTLLASAALAQAPAPAPRQGPAPVSAERGVETVAVVESIDHQKREVLLRRADGTLATFHAGREVRNLAQVKAGDRVVLRYVEAVAVALAPPGSATPSRSEGAAAVRAAQGERPGLAAAEVVRRRVKILNVDPGSGTVTFQEGTRPPQTVVLRRPDMLEFAKGLKPGDEVNVSYAEAMMIAVAPSAQ